MKIIALIFFCMTTFSMGMLEEKDGNTLDSRSPFISSRVDGFYHVKFFSEKCVASKLKKVIHYLKRNYTLKQLKVNFYDETSPKNLYVVDGEMKTLEIRNDKKISTEKLKRFGAVKYITIENSHLENGCEFPKGLFELASSSVPTFGSLPQNLHSLSLSCENVTEKLPRNLHKLEIECWGKLTVDESLKNLRSLKVGFCDNFTGKKLPRCLQIIEILFCPKFNVDESLENLHSLKIRYCNNFDGKGLTKKLQNLYVQGCKNFTGESLPESLCSFEISEWDNKKSNLAFLKRLKTCKITLTRDVCNLLDEETKEQTKGRLYLRKNSNY